MFTLNQPIHEAHDSKIMRTLLTPIALLALTATPAAAREVERQEVAEQSTEEKLSVIEALGTCERLFKDAAAEKAALAAAGWTVPTGSVSPVYSDADAAALRKDGQTIVFLGPQSSFTLENDGFEGSCQFVIDGNSIIAATALAVHLQLEASSFRQNVSDVFMSVAFAVDGKLIEVASLNEAGTAMRLQYAPIVNQPGFGGN